MSAGPGAFGSFGRQKNSNSRFKTTLKLYLIVPSEFVAKVAIAGGFFVLWLL